MYLIACLNMHFHFRRATGHPEGNVYAAAFTPCDCFMVTGSGLGDLRVWDLSSFEVRLNLSKKFSFRQFLTFLKQS